MAVIALAGGGTGGHVYPALAIGDALRERGHTVLYYGDPERLEGRVAPQRGYAFRPVHALQYPRAGLMGKVRFAFGLLRSVLATRGQLRGDGVELVLGVGGYISALPVLAAWTLGRKRVVHEANAVPGLANQLCGRVAQAILLTFPKTASRFREGVKKVVVGVPVNEKVLLGDRAAACARYGLDASQPVALFVGGSLGAQKLNELALAVAALPGRGFQVLHLCGPRYHAEIEAQLGAERAPGYVLLGYEDRMGDAYAAADLVICRAGSATLAELCAVGKPSLLIPSPNVTENHQEENARSLVEAGAALLVVEKGWVEADAAAEVVALMGDAAKLQGMSKAASGLAKLDAASRAVEVIEGVLAGQ